MTTIIDPTGTPSVVYSKSGKTIAEIEANSTTATEIEVVSELTIVLVDALQESAKISFPNGAEIGDLIEVHNVSELGNSTVVVVDTNISADSFNPGGFSNIALGKAAQFRKIGADLWARIGA